MSTSAFRFADVTSTSVPINHQLDLPKMAPDGERVSTKVMSDAPGPYGPGSTIRFRLPAVDLWMDNSTSYVGFYAKVNGGSYRFSEGSHCVVSRLTVSTQSGQQLESLSQYNLRAASLAALTISDDMRRGPLAIAQGYNKDDVEAEDATLQYYVLPLTLSGILGNKKAIPLKYTALIVDITLADAKECLVRYSSAVGEPSYSIEQPSYHISGTRYNDQQTAVMDSLFKSQGVTLYGTTFLSTYLSWSTTSQSLTISNRDSSIKDVSIVCQKESLLNDNVNPDISKLYSYCGHIVDELQFVVAGQYWPSSGPIKRDARHSVFYQHASDAHHHSLMGWRVSPSKWSPPSVVPNNANGNADGSMVIAVEFETAGPQGLISGLTSPSRTKSDITCNVKAWDAAQPLGVKTTAFVHVDCMWKFDPSGEVTIIR